MAFCRCVCSGEEALSMNSDIRSSLYDHHFWSSKCISDWGSTFHDSSLLECWNFPVSWGFLVHFCYYSSDKRQGDLQPFWSQVPCHGDQNLQHRSCLPYKAKSYLVWRTGQVSRKHEKTSPSHFAMQLVGFAIGFTATYWFGACQHVERCTDRS